MIVNSKKFINIFKKNNILYVLKKFLHNVVDHPDMNKFLTVEEGYELYLLFSLNNMRITLIPFPNQNDPEEVFNSIKKSLHLENVVCCRFYSIIQEISH